MCPEAEKAKVLFAKMAPILEEFGKIAFMEIPKVDQDELEAWVRSNYPELLSLMGV